MKITAVVIFQHTGINHINLEIEEPLPKSRVDWGLLIDVECGLMFGAFPVACMIFSGEVVCREPITWWDKR